MLVRLQSMVAYSLNWTEHSAANRRRALYIHGRNRAGVTHARKRMSKIVGGGVGGLFVCLAAAGQRGSWRKNKKKIDICAVLSRETQKKKVWALVRHYVCVGVRVYADRLLFLINAKSLIVRCIYVDIGNNQGDSGIAMGPLGRLR